MGTKFRTMLAPIGLSTGDGRRFASDGIELDATPFPFEWARAREGGHDGAVVVGAVQEAAILTVKSLRREMGRHRCDPVPARLFRTGASNGASSRDALG